MGSPTHLGTPGVFGPHPTFHRSRDGALDSMTRGLLRGLGHLMLLALPVAIAVASYELSISYRHSQLAEHVASIEPALVRLENGVTTQHRVVHSREETAAERSRRAEYLQGRIADQKLELDRTRQMLSSARRTHAALEAEMSFLEERLARLGSEVAREEESARESSAEAARREGIRKSLLNTIDERGAALDRARIEHASELELARHRR